MRHESVEAIAVLLPVVTCLRLTDILTMTARKLAIITNTLLYLS